VREGYTHVLGSVAVGKVGHWHRASKRRAFAEAIKIGATCWNCAKVSGTWIADAAEEKQLSKNAVSRLVDGQSDDFKRGGTGI
jgi:hypothetical protein